MSEMNRFDASADLSVVPAICPALPAVQFAALPLGSAAPGNKKAQLITLGKGSE